MWTPRRTASAQLTLLLPLSAAAQRLGAGPLLLKVVVLQATGPAPTLGGYQRWDPTALAPATVQPVPMVAPPCHRDLVEVEQGWRWCPPKAERSLQAVGARLAWEPIGRWTARA